MALTSVAATYRMADESAGSQKDYYCICFVFQHSIEGYEYEFKEEDLRCDEENY